MVNTSSDHPAILISIYDSAKNHIKSTQICLVFLALLNQGGLAEQVRNHVRQDVKNQYDQTTLQGKRDIIKQYYLLRHTEQWDLLEEEVMQVFHLRMDTLVA